MASVDASDSFGMQLGDSIWTVWREGDTLDLPPGIHVPTRARGVGRVGVAENPSLRDGQQLELQLLAVYADQEHRFELVDFRVCSVGSSLAEITGGLLRALPVQTYLREVVVAATWPRSDAAFSPEVIFWFNERAGMTVPRLPAPHAHKPGSRGTMRDVAAVYRMAQITSDPPVRAVEQAFGLERHTALYWIRRARSGGFLEDRA